MSSHARHRAPGRAITPLSDVSFAAGAKTATIALTAAGVAVSTTPAQAAPGPSTAVQTATVTAEKQAALKQASVVKTRSYKTAAKTTAAKTGSAKTAAVPFAKMTKAQKMRMYKTYTHYRQYHTDENSTFRGYLKGHKHFTVAGAPASSKARAARTRLLTIMRRYEGIMYRYGGTTPAGFDCSGFTSYVYRQVGYKLPRTSSAQRRAGRTVSRAAGRPGDLVWMPGHVGIYLGNGMMYDSPRSGKAIGARKIWRSNYKIIRVIND